MPTIAQVLPGHDLGEQEINRASRLQVRRHVADVVSRCTPPPTEHSTVAQPHAVQINDTPGTAPV
jgi:hypothetical protein